MAEVKDLKEFRVPRNLLYSPNLRAKENLPHVNLDDFQPKVLDWYTVSRGINDGTDVYRGHDKTLLRYFRMPSDPSNVNFDLNIENQEEGVDPSVDASSQLNHLLSWIMSYVERNGNQILQIMDFVCAKNDLKAIMNLTYTYSKEDVMPFYFNAIKIGQMVFIIRIENKDYDEILRARAMLEMKQGGNFVKYLYAETWDGEVRPKKPFTNKREALRLTHHVTLRGHRILYVSEHKGLDGHPDLLDDLPQTGYIPTSLLRTRKEPLPNKDHNWQVLLKWWQICKLINAEKAIIGHRQVQDKSGIVRNIEIIPTTDLLKRTTKALQNETISKVGTGVFAKNWRTGQAMPPANGDDYESFLTDASFGFLVQFLDYVKSTLPQGVGEGPHVVYQFTWHPKDPEVVRCQKLTGEKGVAASFIPDRFTQWLTRHT